MLVLSVPALVRAEAVETLDGRAKAAFDRQAWDESAELYGSLLESGKRADARTRQGFRPTCRRAARPTPTGSPRRPAPRR
jgi:hypothetical protein